MAHTTPPFNCDMATEYAVAPVEAFQLRVGLSVVTVTPGGEVPPGESPVGVGGTDAMLTIKYRSLLQLLHPALLNARMFQRYFTPLCRVPAGITSELNPPPIVLLS